MEWTLPGTVLAVPRQETDLVEERLKALFLAGGISLSQVAGITGLEPYTVQNWVKRGFLSPPVNKRYSLAQLCRIITINMLKNVLPMERICGMLGYINGQLNDETDDIIPESVLYDYVCRAVDVLADGDSAGLNQLNDVVESVVSSYEERVAGAKKRLSRGISVIVTSYYSTLVKNHAENMIDEYCGTMKTKK